MSGHSKWANIKHKKEKTDATRGKIFTKLGRELAVAVKEGGSDPNVNSRLKDTIAKAKSNNMPNDTIERSIKKASGELGNINYEEMTYEGYGVAGVAVIVEALSDNRNRTASDVRHAFDKNGGSLGQTGCVSWMFERKGVIVLDAEGKDEEELMMQALDAGAEDFSSGDGVAEVITDPESFSAVREAFERAGCGFISAEVDMVPKTTVELAPENQEKIQNLLDMLEDNDDVQNVYHNGIMDEDEE